MSPSPRDHRTARAATRKAHPSESVSFDHENGPTGRSFQATDTSRVEAFSDAVLAIAITILALEMVAPPHESGELMNALVRQWPVYLGYLTSFAYIGVIWLNHHQAFTRIRVVDRGLHAANLTLLLTSASLPFPTGVLSEAIQEDLSSRDARTAVALYALIAAAMCASWFWIFVHLARHRDILAEWTEPHYVQHGLLRSSVGVLTYLLGGVLGHLVTPIIALVVFLVLPIFYFLSSEGFQRGQQIRPR